jgi:hypothetical protein
MEWLAIGIAMVLVVGLGLAFALRQRLGRLTGPSLAHARKTFHLRREWLEAHFFKLASRSGKPRGLEWVECDFEDAVQFARDRHTGHLRALVAVTIRFVAVEGGAMEDNPNVGNLRAATAVFLLDGKEWSTSGRAIFNLNPSETIVHLHEDLELAE